ncbi:MAG: TonB-dependent receptor [Sphingomonas sp.]|jgi:iron complex outermembrane receptor protein|uniref:TonB-dependent receptor n=1 Tax=Sphingomonas sp. TaxID=28214 RepID=UPI0035673F70
MARYGYCKFASLVLRSSVCAGALALAAGQAQAQQAPTAPSPAADNGEGADIIVTAQKRAERLQDVPIAISVVSPQILQSTNARNFAELQGVVPGVYFAGNSGGGRTYITLRGATGLALNTGDEPVAIYMDDIYLARGVTIGMSDLLDLGGIEIVRGPQGTLQGRNATAGAILIRSADPTQEFSGRAQASIASPDEFRAQAAISGPLGGGFGARLSGGYVTEKGWAYSPYTRSHIGGSESFQTRGVLTNDSGPFSARIVADYSWTRNQPAIFRYAATTFAAGNGALVPAGTATPNTPLPAATRDAIFNRNIISLNPGTNTEVSTGGVSAKFSYDLGGIDLISVTGYRKAWVRGTNDSDGLDVVKMGYNHNDDHSNQFSQEVRLQSSGSQRFSWILGAYYFQENQRYTDDIYNLKFSLPTNGVTRYTGTQRTRSYAGFADATFRITDQFSVIGGVRYTEDRKKLDSKIIATNLDTNVSTTTPYSPPEAKWTDWSYRGKLVYKPNADLMFFIGYGKGFRAGGYNPFAVQVPYAPETNKSWEAGAKGDLFDRRLSFSLAAYRNDYANLQLRAGVPTGGAIITNAAEALIKGVELELTARPTDRTRLTGNVAYTDAKFTSFPTARDTLDRPVDASGNVLPRTPKWQFFAGAEQDVPLSDSLMLTGEMNYRWRGRIYFFFTDQNAQPWQDGPGDELGARLSIHPVGDRWKFSIYGTNLTNSRIINTAAVTFSYPQVGLNKPRTVGASAEFKF